jgi:hypothetical protein
VLGSGNFLATQALHAAGAARQPDALDTLVEPPDAIGLELDIRTKRQAAKPTPDYSPLKIHATV